MVYDKKQGCVRNNGVNERRVTLIDKKFAEGLSDDEQEELDRLNEEMDAYVNRVAPLPFDHLEKIKRIDSMNLKLEFFDWYESFFNKEADLTKLYDLCMFYAYKAGKNSV